MNIPFDSHQHIVGLQKLNGIELGFHHYERRSAVRMVESISSTMKMALLQHIKTSESTMSIIVDTSTDASQNNYLIVYIQTLESQYPRIYFYRLIRLQSETAERI